MKQQLLDSAFGAYQAGHFEAAAGRCREALAAFDGDESLLTLLAMSEHAAGRNDAAAAAFAELANRFPQVPEYPSNEGLMLRLAGRHEAAEQAYLRALALAPRSEPLLVDYGLLLLDMGRLGAARHRFLDAVEANPASAMARIHASVACFRCGDLWRAEAMIPPPESWPGLDLELRHELATALIHVGRVREAEDVLAPAASGPQDSKSLVRMAMLHERTNRLASAHALLERIDPRNAYADPQLRSDVLTVSAALAMRQKDYVRARHAMRELLAMDLPAAAHANAWFTLAKLADKEGNAAEAMDFLEKAHAIELAVATEIAPDIAGSGEEPLRVSMRMMSEGEAGFSSNATPGATRSPVFILGFPRSGTTMLEQMLDAHPDFVSMDEQPILQLCAEHMQALGLDYPHQLDQVDAKQLEALRATYWHEAGKLVTLDGQRTLVDKNPLNLMRLPMIRRLFPDARIILALRHPCDVLLSCYMQNFRSPAFMLLCSSLERLAKSYVNSMRNWIHHEALLQPNVLKLRYEETVGDFADQVDRIADFLGIEDRTPLAEFSTHAARKGYISTPSYAQVVEPVNTRAVARWHAYREWFAPVLPILQPVASHWGYTLESQGDA